MFGRRARTPSMQDLIAFEAACRLGSFSAAATELSLTQGAISRQIAGLEATIGVQLFRRTHRRISLTDAGRVYFSDVGSCLSRLSEATDRVATFGTANVISLAVLPTFAARWLIPRLPNLTAQMPGLTVNCFTRSEPFDFAHQPFDAAIHFGHNDWPGAIGTHLCGEVSVAVGTPALLDKQDPPRLYLSSRLDAWDEWRAAQGAAPVGRTGPRYDQFSMLLEAAAAGFGAAIIPRFIVAPDLASGRLVELPGNPIVDRRSYWLMRPADRPVTKAVETLTSWLVLETADARQDTEAASTS